MRALLALLAWATTVAAAPVCVDVDLCATYCGACPVVTTTTTTATSSTTSSTAGTATCRPQVTVSIACADLAHYDFFTSSYPAADTVICAGQEVACDVFAFNTSPPCADPAAQLGVLFAGLTVDRVVDGQVVRTTGQTFPTQQILSYAPGASNYQADPGQGGALCTTNTSGVDPSGGCTVNLVTFDPIMTADEIGHDVSIRATWIVREEATLTLDTLVTSAPVTVVACP